MSSKEVSSNKAADDQALSQPKIIWNDVHIEPESLKQDKEDSNPVPPETKLSNQVVKPMSRGNENDETPTAAAGEEAKTSTKGANTSTRGAGEFPNNFTRDDSIDLEECCLCCLESFCCVLCIPCMVVDTVLDCLRCPFHTCLLLLDVI